MKTDDELIAEYMGFKPFMGANSAYVHPDLIGVYGGRRGMKFRYWTWDWLMPVIERIEENPNTTVNMFKRKTKITVTDEEGLLLFETIKYSCDEKIAHVYAAAVDYINYINQKQP